MRADHRRQGRPRRPRGPPFQGSRFVVHKFNLISTLSSDSLDTSRRSLRYTTTEDDSLVITHAMQFSSHHLLKLGHPRKRLHQQDSTQQNRLSHRQQSTVCRRQRSSSCTAVTATIPYPKDIQQEADLEVINGMMSTNSSSSIIQRSTSASALSRSRPGARSSQYKHHYRSRQKRKAAEVYKRTIVIYIAAKIVTPLVVSEDCDHNKPKTLVVRVDKIYILKSEIFQGGRLWLSEIEQP